MLISNQRVFQYIGFCYTCSIGAHTMKIYRSMFKFKAPNQFLKTCYKIVVLTLMVAVFACSDRKPSPSVSEATSEPGTLSDLMAQITPEGWTLYDQVDLFTAENLYERINGRAELYLAYNVVNMATVTYEDKTDSGRFVELSVFDMGDPTNAFGIFSVERFQGEPPLELGRSSYRSDANVYVWKGKFYIAVVTSDITEEFQQRSLDIADKVTEFLSDSGEPVWGLITLPQDQLIHDSVQYFKVDAMGLDFMTNVYTAEYRHGETTVKAFLSQQADSDAALGLVEQYASFSREYGRDYTRMTKDGVEYIVCDMGGSFDVIFSRSQLVFGVISVKDRETAIKLASDLWLADIP